MHTKEREIEGENEMRFEQGRQAILHWGKENAFAESSMTRQSLVVVILSVARIPHTGSHMPSSSSLSLSFFYFSSLSPSLCMFLRTDPF